MKKYEELVNELDENQRAAARAEGNSVVAAGAGSGKTRVLAARYVHLVVEKGIDVDSILALTFTRKAAAEMYSRIYATLREIDHPLARDAVANFHLARIDTIDAFCGSVARSACRRYGVSPDFTVDNDEAKILARDLALPFFLEHRSSAAIRQLMKRYSLAELPARLFADSMVKYSTVSSPLDFASFRETQKSEIRRNFDRSAAGLVACMNALSSLADAGGNTARQVGESLAEIPSAPDIDDKAEISEFLGVCARVARISLPAGRITNPRLVELKENLASFRKELYPEFGSLANYALNEEIVLETFALLSEFQERFNAKKRESGVLTFSDVSRLALDALRDDPELRRAYKESIRAIMIDEFQDDNAMQRDLLFLIAERPDRDATSVPSPTELCPDKLFFVGDEKQSIYKFRGADVSVFRKLAADLAPSGDGADAAPGLGTNYRTETPLIESFNAIFPSVFLNERYWADGSFPLYEATFAPIVPSRKTEGLEPSLDVLFVSGDGKAENGPNLMTPPETEAAEIAARIRKLVEDGYAVRGEDGPRPCAFDDIAILFRTGGKQHLFEQHLRSNGIPYQAESLHGLFGDAPINDIYALLRLAVYPADNTAYATVLRSPFVSIGDEGFALAVLDRTTTPAGYAQVAPFAESAESGMSDADLARFRNGRRLYEAVRDRADRLATANVVSWLWYDEGYRYEILSDPSLHRYAELYDYFYELARQADSRGQTLAAFLDRIQELMTTGEKIDGLDIPVEKTGGVRLMTVHKSKGLEFPVVFLVDCANEGKNEINDAPVFFSSETGLSVNTGAADGTEGAKSNWFYEKGRDEEKNREQAELRRLLYVAMTRAETRLVVSGVLKTGEEPGDEPRTKEELREILRARLDKKDEKAADTGEPVRKRSFFDLLFGALAGGDIPGVTLTEVLPGARAARGAGAQAALGVAASEVRDARYHAAPDATYPPSPKTRYSATGLREDDEPANDGKTARASDALDILLRKTGTPADKFGTWAHETIESRFTGTPPFMPEELRAAAESMADSFFRSELGRMAQNAAWRESEFAFITRWVRDGERVTVTGQMDLAFELDGKVYVVDYKTDRDEIPDRHREQLAVYRKAAGDLYGKPVETWLFYLRTGHAVPIRDHE